MEPSFMRSRDEGTSYLLLFITITAAVTIGNILSTAVIGMYAEHRAGQALAEADRVLRTQVEATQRSMQQAQIEQANARAAQQQAIQRQRASDATGQALSRSCNEWREANAKLNSYTTRTETAKSCNRYEHYLTTGIVSNRP